MERLTEETNFKFIKVDDNIPHKSILALRENLDNQPKDNQFIMKNTAVFYLLRLISCRQQDCLLCICQIRTLFLIIHMLLAILF